jgi:hypothetical protein
MIFHRGELASEVLSSQHWLYDPSMSSSLKLMSKQAVPSNKIASPPMIPYIRFLSYNLILSNTLTRSG